MADVPSIPTYEGMPQYAPVITKIADGMIEEVDDIKSDDKIIKYQEEYSKVRRGLRQIDLDTAKVLDGLDAVMTSVRLGRVCPGHR